VLAAPNHPNIAQIHGLEKADGVTALVMKLIRCTAALRKWLYKQRRPAREPSGFCQSLLTSAF
jgi:hypothetical protein